MHSTSLSAHVLLLLLMEVTDAAVVAVRVVAGMARGAAELLRSVVEQIMNYDKARGWEVVGEIVAVDRRT